MKLLERKTFPKITLSVSGKILHMNLEAKRELSTLSLGQSIIEIIDAKVRDAAEKDGEGDFDKVLVDAPCSGLGLFTHKPKT